MDGMYLVEKLLTVLLDRWLSFVFIIAIIVFLRWRSKRRRR